MNEREYCDLRFSTSLGKTRLIRIANPMAALGPNTVNIASSAMISTTPFDETIGQLTELKRADRVFINRTVLIPQA